MPTLLMTMLMKATFRTERSPRSSGCCCLHHGVVFDQPDFRHHAPVINFTLIALISILKATLVVAFFMHLKINWRKVFAFLVPICVLAPMVIIVWWPDMVSAWRLGK